MSNANRHTSTDIHVIYIYIYLYLQKDVLSSHNDISTTYIVTLKSMYTARYESVRTEGRDALLFLSFSYDMRLSELIYPKYALG